MSHSSIGPIDVALLEFPEHTPTGEVAAELLAAADAGVIALYDIIAVRKGVDERGQLDVLVPRSGSEGGHRWVFLATRRQSLDPPFGFPEPG